MFSNRMFSNRMFSNRMFSNRNTTMRIGHIELFVRNPLKAREFYANVLGFEEIAIQQGQYIWMKSGDTEILLRPGKNSNRTFEYQQTSIGLVLYTNNFERTFSELKSRGLIFQGNDGSERCLTFTDPDGNWFQLVDPSDH